MFLIIAPFTEGRSILDVDDHATENLRKMKSNLEQIHQEGRLFLLLLAAGISAQISHSVEGWLYLLCFSKPGVHCHAHFGASCHLD